MLRILFVLFIVSTCPVPTNCQQTISYPAAGWVYNQLFDGLPNSGTYPLTGKGPLSLAAAPVNASSLAGWQFWLAGGSNQNAVIAVSTGSSTGNGTYSLGSTGSTDRALGSLAASSGVYAFGVLLTNASGIILNTCTISFTCEQWRKGGSGNRNTWAFRYKTGNFTGIDQLNCSDEHGLDLNSVQTSTGAAALNGNLAENQQQFSITLRNFRWNPGEQLLLRWDDADESGSDDICAIDNFHFNASQTVAPPSVVILPATNITSETASISAMADDHFSKTAVWFELDTSSNFTHAQFIKAMPDTLQAGAGNSPVTAQLTGLRSGAGYYFRLVAANQAGTTTSNTGAFTTTFSLPLVTTLQPSDISPAGCTAGGKIISDGGTPVSEQGIVWSVTDTPTINSHKIVLPNNDTSFVQQLSGLPPATNVLIRAFATNPAGTAYGDTRLIIIPTTILSITPTAVGPLNSAAVTFVCKTAQPLTGLAPSNFAVSRSGWSDTIVTSITGSGTSYTITVNPGNADCMLQLHFVTDAGCSAPIYNLPFASTPVLIDKTSPQVTSLTIPDTIAKIGDTVSLSVMVKPDTATFTMGAGTLNGIALKQFTKRNDSLYRVIAIIPNNGTDIAAAEPIPASISLTDPAGNTTVANTFIRQPHTRIDANKPVLSSISLPANRLHRAGDTLQFVLHFSEKVNITQLGAASGFSVTIGNRTKFTKYVYGSGSDTLVTQYIIPAGDADKDGIHINNPVVWLNGSIQDLAGNSALLSVTIPDTKNILVDGIAPSITAVAVPAPAAYQTGNMLDFLVTFTEKVWVTGKPSLPLQIGSLVRQAAFISGSGSNSLLFRYTVLPEDIDTDGIKTGSVLSLDDASIADEAGNLTGIALSNTGPLLNVLINPPTITMLRLQVPANGIYTLGDTLFFIASFNEPVLVQSEKGRPALRVTIGSSSKQAVYFDGSGSVSLVFMYVVQKGDLDTNGIQLGASYALNGGAIADSRGNNIALTLLSVGNTTEILIDAAAPTIKAVIVPTKKVYREGDTLRFAVSCSEPVFIKQVGESPYIRLMVGTAIRQLQYTGGSGTSTLHFNYIVALHDLDKGGINIDSVIMPGYLTITDQAGNMLIPGLKNIGALSGIKVDAEPPVIAATSNKLTICENGGASSLTDLLALTDAEDDEELSWSLALPPAHGRISKTAFTLRTNGRKISPAGISYEPEANFNGADSLVFKVSDGVNELLLPLSMRVLPSIANNYINGTASVCASVTSAPMTGSMPAGGDGTYSAVWETATTDSTVFTRIPNANNLLQYRPGKLTSDIWLRRRIESATCYSISQPLKITVLKNGFWTGTSDSIWKNPNNWCNNAVPTLQADVIIDGQAPFLPVIKDSASCNDLVLRNQAFIQLNGILQVNGSLLNNGGIIDASHGCLQLNGSHVQAIPAIFAQGIICELIADNDSAVQIDAPVFITKSLTLRSGTLVTNNNLHLRHNARIAPAAAGTSVKGNVSIQHQLQAAQKGFHMLGHPFACNFSLDVLKGQIDITGQGGVLNGFTSSANDEPSAFYYDPAATNDTAGACGGWVPFANTSGPAPDAWREGRGIRLQVFNTNGKPVGFNNATQPVTIALTGPVHMGDVDVDLSGTNTTRYHAVGNPYPSPVDFSTVARGSSVGRHYWMWNKAMGKHGGYLARPFNVSNKVHAFGAVIVKTTGSSEASLMFRENCKREAGDDEICSFAPADTHFIELWLEDDSTWYDKLLIVFSDSARRFYDDQDAEKLMNESYNFYSLSAEKRKLAIDARPHTNQGNVTLGIQPAEAGKLRIRVGKITLPGSNELQLHDRLLNRWMKLQADSSYEFEITQDSLSQGEKRFELATPPKKNADSIIYFKVFIQVFPQPARESAVIKFAAPQSGNTVFRLYDQWGVLIREHLLGTRQSGSLQVDLSRLAAGLYMAEIRCGNYAGVQKIIRQ